MKKFFLLVLLFISSSCLFANPKHEFRATWFTTHYGIDWPTTKATSDSKREKQKQEMIAIFDKMQAGNMNAVCMQVRSLCDAMYRSSYEPWSSLLTGTRGKDPGYDPLAFAVEEAHKRGLELHLWVNPFRVTSSGTIDTSDKIWQNAGQWIIKYDNGSFSGQIIDPGYPEAREYVLKVLMEIVNNYNVDGILMDDYFYPYGGTTTEDTASKALHKPANVVDVNQDGDTDDDWRRANVDSCMKMLYDSIQAVKPWVRFGMGTFGIWTTQKKAANAYGITLPSGITGLDDYDVQACNPVEWIKNGYVDYVNPQLYWSTVSTGQDYDVLCKWWAKDVCEHFSELLPGNKKVHFFSSQAAYRVYESTSDAAYSNDGVVEIQRQITANRNNLSSGYTGSVFYHTTAYQKMYMDLAESHFVHKALTPPMDWKVTETLQAPSNLTLNGNTLSWSHSNAERYTVYVYPYGYDTQVGIQPQYLKQVVYGNEITLEASDMISTIAVCSYDRYGVEHGVAVWNEGEFPESDPNATEITWVLNGGEIKTIVVPTNEELWEMWKVDYVKFYSNKYGSSFVAAEDRTMDDILGFTWIYSLGGGLAMEFMMEDPNWKWLRDYMLAIAQSDGFELNSDSDWRYHLYAFFNCDNASYRVDGYCPGPTADFTEAGKPEAWGPYYTGYKETDMELPSQVTETYILPTPVHPEGKAFIGWSTSALYTGKTVVAIPAGWVGTLYAIWEGDNPPASVGTILDIAADLEIYDLMGRKVGTNIHKLPGGIYIVKQGKTTIKITK